MPNWCENTLTVTGPAADREALWVAVAEDPATFVPNEWNPDPSALSLERIVPQPPEILAALDAPQVPDVGLPDWYEWRLAHWGTKWDVRATRVEGPGTECDTIEFDSAWGPPIEAIVALSRAWPTLVFTLAYDEPGMDFGGYVILQAGEERDGTTGGSRRISWADLAEGATEAVTYDPEGAR